MQLSDVERQFAKCSLSDPTTEHEQAQAGTLLQLLPDEIISSILSEIDLGSLARLAATCCLLWCDAPAAPTRRIGPVEVELRRRAVARGFDIGSSLPLVAAAWVPYLLQRERHDVLRRYAPLAAGHDHSMFVNWEGRLLTCGSNSGFGYPHDGRGAVLGHVGDEVGPPTLVPSTCNTRFSSVATGRQHCLALSAEGEVYSWGDGRAGQLGHGEATNRSVPSRIESLERIESIAAGASPMSAAVDDRGRLFTFGFASPGAYPNGLGYPVGPQTTSQLTPRRVDALSQHRVVGVALGASFTLAVTDAGAVFSFGYSEEGALGHDMSTSEVLPRRIESLAQTGRRFVAVAAGIRHALAVSVEGQLYGWGHGGANGHGRGNREPVPRRVQALLGERVKLVGAGSNGGWSSSCAVTETGELFTWGFGCRYLGRGGVGEDDRPAVPKRVARLRGVRVVAVAMGCDHMVVADEHGGAWACGRRPATGLYDPEAWHVGRAVPEPTLIPSLRVFVANAATRAGVA